MHDAALQSRPKITDERHKHRDQAQSHGVHHLALWHAIGHEHNTILTGQPTKGAVLSSEMVKVPGYKIGAVAEFFRAFTPVTQAVGALFDALDHQNYQRYSELFHRMADDTAASIIRTASRNCFLGMAVLTGLCCSPHRDSRDTMDGWVADMAFGDFEGGYFRGSSSRFAVRPSPWRCGVYEISIVATLCFWHCHWAQIRVCVLYPRVYARLMM